MCSRLCAVVCGICSEGLYVKFEGFPEEMLITNEDDWQWGSHSRKPPASANRR